MDGMEAAAVLILATVVVMVDLEVPKLVGAAAAVALVDIAVMVVMLAHSLDLLDLEEEVAAERGTQIQTLMTPNAKAAVEVV
jgi:hypothetical protein